MKKRYVLISIFIGIISSIITIVSYNYLYKYNKNKSVNRTVVFTQAPVKLASYSTNKQDNFPDFTYAAQKSINSVVHVKSFFAVSTYTYDPLSELLWGHRYRPNQKLAVATGSGVIVSSDGYIVTNNHVIDRAEKIEVTLNDKRTYLAEVIGVDENTDLALLKIEAENLSPITFGNSDDVKVGQWVLAVGNPFNLTSTVTAGIVSAKGRNLNIINSRYAIESFIQTDAAVNPGNSGGALVNTEGELIGINTAIASNTGSYMGYSFAIPVNIVKKVVSDILTYGSVQRAFMGVSIANVSDIASKNDDIDMNQGVYIMDLQEGGAAKEAGIRKGDIIIGINENKINTVNEMQEKLSVLHPGDKINVTVYREGKTLKFPVTLKGQFGENKAMDSKELKELINVLGAYFEPVSKEEMNKLNIKNGVKVSKLINGKLAQVGVREGFIITKINKKPVNNIEELKKIISKTRGGILLEGIYPNGTKAYYGFGLP